MAQARGAKFSFTQNIIAELTVGTGKLIVLHCAGVTCVLALLVEHLGSEDLLYLLFRFENGELAIQMSLLV